MRQHGIISFFFALLAAVALRGIAQDAPGPFDGLRPDGALGGNPKPTVSVDVIPSPNDPARATLFIKAVIPPGYHIYSVTQQPGGPVRTEIQLEPSPAYKLASDGGKPSTFVAQEKPHHNSSQFWPGVVIEEHSGTVHWSAPIELEATSGPVDIAGRIAGQICDEGSCLQFKEVFKASYTPSKPSGVYSAKPNFTLRGHVNAKTVAPGSKVQIVLSAEPASGWHLYELSDKPKSEGAIAFNTLVVIDGAAGKRAEQARTAAPLTEKDGQKYYEGPVQFTVDLEIPPEVNGKDSFAVTGMIGYQICTAGSCDRPTGVRFLVPLPVGDKLEAGEAPLTFSAAEYDTVKEAKENSLRGQEPIDWSKFAVILGAAFLGGAILNLMPCVLPVLGLKILGFVEQAHQSSRESILLNLWYSLGLMFVFMVLAAVSVALGAAWGEQFTKPWFNIALASVVWVMALSFLGVWEIPIPGFIGSGRTQDLAQREGATGAFAKGAVTTVLATPCSGPFLGAVFGFTLDKPAPVVFAVFGAIGMGMAAPYLIIGAFPQLARWLPKPGAWMDTFKQFMGFVLLGTVLFVLTFVNRSYFLPTFGLLLSLWLACWWLGRTPHTSPMPQRLKAWGVSGALAALLGWVSFAALSPRVPILAWKPFSTAAIQQDVLAGHTVMVDFTAEWCLTCKRNLAWAVDTHATKAVVDKNGVQAYLADWTEENEDIKAALNSLQSNSIPLLAVYPAGKPHEPILLRDWVSQEEVLQALERAGPSKTPTPPSNPNGSRTAMN